MVAMEDALVVGIDFGTLSGRAVVVRVADGAELGAAVQHYAHGVVEARLPGVDVDLPPAWALQVPDDYRSVLREAVPEAVNRAGVDPTQVVGVGTDFTACTMVPTDERGVPLCELPVFDDRPHAYVKLWRHHAAQAQADRINSVAAQRQESWLARYGGFISSEWEFAKGLQILEEDPEVYDAMRHWVEAADWIVWQLTGTYTRNACSAGYKGILQDGRYPSPEFLAALNPQFADFVTDKVEWPIVQLGARAGKLTEQAARWTGLPAGITVAAGNVDAHVTSPAVQATEPGRMVAIMGTSTCHVMNGDRLAEVPGMCGVVHGGITPDLWGYEAGQSGVGDIFGWFAEHCVPASYHEAASARGVDLHQYLSDLASQQEVGAHGLLALDWHSGNRSVLVDHDLSGVVIGQTLATRAEDLYRALIEATAFGTRMIIKAFTESGLPVTEFVAAGGLTKNSFLMQVYADVLGMPISVAESDQAPALGSAIHAAVAAGFHESATAASAAMGGKRSAVHRPVAESVERYDELFAEYECLHDYFGRGHNEVLHRLTRIRQSVTSGGRGGTPGPPLPQRERSNA